MHATSWPTSTLGLAALGLLTAFALLFALKVTVGFPLVSFAIFGIGILGVLVGVVAVIRRDVSWTLIVFGGLVAAFILFWTGGEILFPH